MDLEGHRSRGLGQRIKGGQGNEHLVAHSTHLHQDVSRIFIEKLAF